MKNLSTQSRHSLLKVSAYKIQAGATRIPEHIFQMANLVKLDLSGSNIEELDPRITELTNLKVLNLSGTCITKLPRAIGKLSKLTEIDMSRTQIYGVPKEFLKLDNLREINIRHSPLSDNGKAWGRFTHVICALKQNTCTYV